MGWQPSRFLADWAEAERAFALAEQLGSVNAARLSWAPPGPSLRKAFTRHGLGMPARNPEAVRQRAFAAANQRGGPPTAPPLDPVFVALTPASSRFGVARILSRAAAVPDRGDRDTQLPHRGGAQRREPTRLPAAGPEP
jgi:hypothetical protein